MAEDELGPNPELTECGERSHQHVADEPPRHERVGVEAVLAHLQSGEQVAGGEQQLAGDHYQERFHEHEEASLRQPDSRVCCTAGALVLLVLTQRSASAVGSGPRALSRWTTTDRVSRGDPPAAGQTVAVASEARGTDGAR